MIKYSSVVLALIVPLILVVPATASGTDAASSCCPEIDSSPQTKSILRATPNTNETSKGKTKKKVSWLDVVQVKTFVNPKIADEDCKHKQPRTIYSLSLEEEEKTLAIESLEFRAKQPKTLVPMKSKTYNPQTLNSTAQYYMQKALKISSQENPYVYVGVAKELKEVSAGHLCFMAARLYLVAISAMEQEKMLNENLCRPLDAGKNDPVMLAKMEAVWSQFTPDMYADNFRAYKCAVNIGTQMFYEALLKATALDEFHSIGSRLIKLFYTQIQLGSRGEAIRRVMDIDAIIHQRMQSFHRNSKYERHVEKMIRLEHQAYEQDILDWQTKVDDIKKSKGRKAHKTARLLHARNMLAATQQELKDMYKPSSEWMKLLEKARKSYADEDKHGCEHCIVFLHALDQLRNE